MKTVTCNVNTSPLGTRGSAIGTVFGVRVPTTTTVTCNVLDEAGVLRNMVRHPLETIPLQTTNYVPDLPNSARTDLNADAGPRGVAALPVILPSQRAAITANQNFCENQQNYSAVNSNAKNIDKCKWFLEQRTDQNNFGQ